MKRILHIFSLIIGLVLINSCAESDPAQVYGWDDPNDISGPRMIKKAMVNNQTSEAYAVNDAKLFKVDRFSYSGTAVEENQAIYVYYLGNRISRLEMNGTVPGGSANGRYVLTPNYDNTSGQMVSLMNDFYVGNTHTQHSVTTFNHDAEGRVINAYKKTATVDPAAPNVYVYPNIKHDVISYEGVNVARVESSEQLLNTTTGVIVSSVKTTYEYGDYDWRHNPYLGIADDYIIAVSSIFPDMYSYMSDNNPAKLKFTVGSDMPVETVYIYKFDTHNYPTSNGIRSFTYQPAP